MPRRSRPPAGAGRRRVHGLVRAGGPTPTSSPARRPPPARRRATPAGRASRSAAGRRRRCRRRPAAAASCRPAAPAGSAARPRPGWWRWSRAGRWRCAAGSGGPPPLRAQFRLGPTAGCRIDARDAAVAVVLGRQPFQRGRVPRIADGRLGPAQRARDVDEEQHATPAANTKAPTVDSRFRPAPAQLRRIGVDAARHAQQARDVHREEGQVLKPPNISRTPSAPGLRTGGCRSPAAASNRWRRTPGTPSRRSARSGSGRR
jgi:hypothetical protein